jgi:primary-amine oxidase
VYLNETLNNSTGDAVDYPNAICIREEDAGILWKHVDYRNGRAVVVRSHRLVISFIATVGNYEYVFLWQFYQDGSIQLNIQLTGILSINLLAVGSAAGDYGTMEAPQIYAPYHQHFFSVRLDMEVDGNNNSVYTTEAVPVDAPTGSEMNPYGQGFTTKRTPLRTQGEGRTNFSAETGKVWAISNPSKMHPYTRQPVAWKLMPVNSPGLKMKEDSPLRPKAAFLDYDVWVTKYEEGQLFAGGYYLNADGLNEWVGNDTEASIEDKDIVLWHNFGLTHIPRVEDYPVMPVE